MQDVPPAKTNKQNNAVMINQECCTLKLTWVSIMPTHSINSYFLIVPPGLMMIRQDTWNSGPFSPDIIR